MTVSLKNNFFANARCVRFLDANGISWSINSNTNEITASYAGAGSAAANPTAKVGLTAVNGTAATFMRSDAAPPLDQAISPTWSGTHTFSATAVLSGGAATYSGNTGSIPNGTATTIKTLPNGGSGMGYLVFASLVAGAGSPGLYSAAAVVNVSGSSATVASLLSGTALSITVSGLNVQVTQSSGATQSTGVSWTVLRVY